MTSVFLNISHKIPINVCLSMSDDISSVASGSFSPAPVARTETYVSRAPTTIVPKLCLFQWEGQVFDRTSGHQVFADLKACIQHFEDIMNSHCLDLDNNYLRLLPPLLSPTARIWYDDFLTNYRTAHAASPSWNDFTTGFTARYGLNVHEERARCARELTKI
ncbi:hypothetical protein MFLAVUS_010419 [Mucor flavus]|uniref:Uncharacterized protein n=1 Tax=Mucor flavus TaxID=439312 RepID=A0ABP9ZCM4_9FUNG